MIGPLRSAASRVYHSRRVRISLLLSAICYLTSLILSPFNTVMGVQLEWARVWPYLRDYGFLFLYYQLLMLLKYFLLWWLLLFLNEEVAVLFRIPVHWRLRRAAFLIPYLFIGWGSLGRNPQLYYDSLARFGEFLPFLLIWPFFHINPDYFYFFGWLLLAAALAFTIFRHWRPKWSPLAATATLLLLGVCGSSPAPQAGRKILLFLGIDSLRYHELENGDLKNLLLLSRRGTLLADHHTTIPRTFPAFASILTGKYPENSGIATMFPDAEDIRRFHLSENIVSTLHRRGYRTVLAGDYAADFFDRLSLPWTEQSAPKLKISEIISFQTLKSQIFWLPFVANGVGRHLETSLRSLPEFSVADYLADDIIDAMDDSDPGKNLFLLGFFGASHFPYASAWPWYARARIPGYTGRYLVKKSVDLYERQEPSQAEKEQMRSIFRAGLKSADDAIGRILRHLQKTGLDANSIVFVFGDHGENLHERLEDGSVYQGHGEHLRGDLAVTSPVIIHNGRPGAPEPGKIPFMTSHIDLFPTAMALLGEAPPAGENGGPDGTDVFTLRENRPLIMQTGIWFSRGGNFSFQRKRLMYPEMPEISRLDENGFLVIRPEYSSLISLARVRSLDFMSAGRSFRLLHYPGGQNPYEVFRRRPWQAVDCRFEAACSEGRNIFRREMRKLGYFEYEDKFFPVN